MLEPEESGLIERPDYELVEDEAFPPFPPPVSPERDGEDAGADGPGEEAESAARVPVPPKKTVKRNLPKLDAQRLTSEKGLPALRHMFDNTKFKGKGHEAEDLRTLIRHMEHWAHRLFPKLQFEDFIDRVEYLGNKKEVQTCLKRIRLDLPILHEDFVSNNDEAEESNSLTAPAPGLDPFMASSSASEPRPSLTEEQQQRIERNKQLALERRQAKLSNSQCLDNDMLMSTPSTQPVRETNVPEDLEEPAALDTDTAHVCNSAASARVVEEEQLETEGTQGQRSP